MSRAFVSDKEDWIYCAKAGERCMHAEAGRDCRKTDCPHFSHAAKPVSHESAGTRIVTRASKKNTEPDLTVRGKRSGTNASKSGARKGTTKKANIKPPKKWGGRSGN